MSIRLNQLIFVAFFFLSLILLCGAQTTLWYQVFGTLTAPLLWMYLIINTILYYNRTTSLFLVYGSSFIIAAFTAVPIKILLITMLILWAIVTFVKNRIFWEGPWYFTLAVLGATFTFEVSYIVSISVLETKSFSIYVWQRLLQILFTTLFAPLFFALLQPARAYFKEKTYTNHAGDLNG